MKRYKNNPADRTRTLGALRSIARSCLILFLLIGNSISVAQTKVELILPIASKGQTGFKQRLQSELENHNLASVTIDFADHWHDYQQGLRLGQPAIYFAAPHFSAWAIDRHGFHPILRIAEPLSYVVSANKAHTNIFELRDLINKQVCSMQPLGLDYLSLTEAFSNKYGSVDHYFIENVKAEMVATHSDCDAFVISNHQLQSIAENGNNNYIRLYQSQNSNNYAFIAHPNVDKELVARLSLFLIQPSIRPLLLPLLQNYANDTTLIPALEQDYPDDYTSELSRYWSEPEATE